MNFHPKQYFIGLLDYKIGQQILLYTLSTHYFFTLRSRLIILLGLMLLLLLPAWSPAQDTDLQAVPGMEKVHPDLLAQMTANAPLPSAGQAITRQATPQMYRVIVNLYPLQDAGNPRNDDLAQLQEHVRLTQDAVLKIRRQGTFTLVTRYQNVFGFLALADEQAILELAAMGDVEFIEMLPTMQKMDLQSHSLTGIDTVHASNFTGDGVTIAIIDDGIDAGHTAFGGDPAWPNAKIIAGHDFADADADPRNDCNEQSHGTAVAGIAAGNGGGVRGTAPDATIVFLKIQSAARCGQAILDGDLLGALDWVVSQRETYGIDIVSMSLGGQAFSSAVACDNASTALRQLLDVAHTSGLVIFAASGNEGQLEAIAQPACMSNIISVGAVYDSNLGSTNFLRCSDQATGPDHVPCYSNSATFLDVLAPAHCAETAIADGGVQACFGGTSSATPFAAGVAATLIEASNTPLDNDGMRSLLTTSGLPVADGKNGTLIPRIDALAALDTLDTAPCTDCILYSSTLSETNDESVQPDGTYYFSLSGAHHGWLNGQAQASFDLYLLKWTGSRWETVAQSIQTGSEESVSYQGAIGFYAWIIHSFEGSGSYDFWLQRP